MMFTFSLLDAYFLSLVIICTRLLPPAECSDNDLIPTQGAVHSCYWCGPQAEQVHRSRRAGSCSTDGKDELIVCDPGYPYCAIVATAPPQIISKKCVRDYQDDCYTRYCNTSKLWKLTCPCKGHLCNGPITDREKTALADLMGKLNKRKRSIQNITDLNTVETATAIILETSITVLDPNKENSIEREIKLEQRIVNDDNELENSLNKNSSSVNSLMNQYPVNNIVGKDTNNVEFTVPTIAKTEATLNAIVTEKPSITIVKLTKMPQIEALQQNITPTTITNEEKVTTTTIMTTQAETTETTIVTIDKSHGTTDKESHVIVTTVKPKKAKNQSIQVVASGPVFISCLVFYTTKFI